MTESIFVHCKLLIFEACWTVFISFHHSPQWYQKMSLIQIKGEIQDLPVLESWPFISTTAAQDFSSWTSAFTAILEKWKKKNKKTLCLCLFQSTKENTFSLYT